ncbi:hypothetical protein FCL47_17695 [Desulfopila sp. IMCC35006]|uniref:hypothetical protein n=1 Tax=Desulfopila sp. IMCC35006 TaxID=2569542 RepID=UPI0010AC0ADC|nr:hypothetical protein [Desulfopila sp. IMCC35006]TKB24665.1 hypothetical protein FCL47_17695 [Desulfopila sp. IMCC35006]
MSLFRPACTITVDGADYTGAEAALRSMDLELCLGAVHDQAIIHCSHLSPLRNVQPDAACLISLGAADAEVAVLSGIVSRVEQQLTGVILEVLADTCPLSSFYGAQAYQDQTIADIIKDLAGQAEVATGVIDASITVKIWHVTEQRSAWWHINRLARMGGCEVLCDETGALTVRPAGSGGLSHNLRFSAEILSLQAGRQRDTGVRQQYAPAGAGSELGSDKWHICLREPAGETPDGPAIIDGALRDRDAAGKAADASAARMTRSLFTGRALITGNGAIRPGDTVDLADVPDQDTINARVLSVQHRLDGQNGFTTILHLGGAS